ncbi:MAG: hypothetical protein LBF72_00890 [Holosporales bacterium]|nr:hypothetical protein [Holosporales bacterium]
MMNVSKCTAAIFAIGFINAGDSLNGSESIWTRTDNYSDGSRAPISAGDQPVNGVFTNDPAVIGRLLPRPPSPYTPRLNDTATQNPNLGDVASAEPN